jgi:hypothetical protein
MEIHEIKDRKLSKLLKCEHYITPIHCLWNLLNTNFKPTIHYYRLIINKK